MAAIVDLDAKLEAAEDPEGEMDDSFIKLLAGHVIGPLVNEYENHVKTLTRDVNMLKIALKSQRDI